MNALPAVDVVLETVTLARIAPEGSLRVVQLTLNGDDELDPHPASSGKSMPIQAMAGGRHFTNQLNRHIAVRILQATAA